MSDPLAVRYRIETFPLGNPVPLGIVEMINGKVRLVARLKDDAKATMAEARVMCAALNALDAAAGGMTDDLRTSNCPTCGQTDMRWQPIETAPKDGTEVLMFCAPDEMVTALWSYSHWSLVQCGSYADDSYLFSDPTHWMPLPAPPHT